MCLYAMDILSDASVNNRPEAPACNIFVIVFSATYRENDINYLLSVAYINLGSDFLGRKGTDRATQWLPLASPTAQLPIGQLDDAATVCYSSSPRYQKVLQVSWFPIDSLYVPNSTRGADDCRV